MKNSPSKLTWHEQGKVTEITDKNFHLLPPELQEAIKITRTKGRGFFLTDKYYDSLFSLQKEQLTTLKLQNPDLSISKVLAQQLEMLPDYIPVEKVKEITNFIFKTWEELSLKESVAA